MKIELQKSLILKSATFHTLSTPIITCQSSMQDNLANFDLANSNGETLLNFTISTRSIVFDYMLIHVHGRIDMQFIFKLQEMHVPSAEKAYFLSKKQMEAIFSRILPEFIALEG